MGQLIVATLSRQLSWSHVVALLSFKSAEARLHYAEQAAQERWSVRELRSQIERKAFERRVIASAQAPAPNVSTAMATELVPPSAGSSPALVFKDPYSLDFLGLHQGYDEADLEAAILRQIEAFILELGRFKAAHKGQTELYLKWLDKHERLPAKKPPIGLILCAESSREQVELLQMHKDGITVAEYWTELPPKAGLEQRLHEALLEARERLAQRGVLLAGGEDE